MHRTEGNGRVLESGKYRFHDRELPTYIGTVDLAEWNNAVQEEICNVIELCGDTIAASSTADRTASWRQLYDCIFQNGHITDSAIDNLTLDVISGGQLELASGAYTLRLEYNEIELLNNAISTTINAGIINLKDITTVNTETTFYPVGCRFHGSSMPGITDFKDSILRKCAFDITGITWVLEDNLVYSASISFVTDIPYNAFRLDNGIISSFISFNNGTYVESCPVAISMRSLAPNTTVFTITSISVLSSGNLVPTTNFRLFIEYTTSV